MEFLRPGDMTLFICFVRFSLLLPTTSPFWNQCVCTGRGSGTECFCGTVSAGVGPQWEQQAHRGESRSSPCFVPAGGALLSHSWAQESSQCFPPDRAGAGIQLTVTLMTLINYPHLLSDRAGSERCNTLKPEEEEVACPDTLPPTHTHTHINTHTHTHTLQGSSLSHFMSTRLSHSLTHSDSAHGLSVCHVNALSWVRLVWLVAPTLLCYQLQRGWTGSVRGQSQLWLVLLGCGGRQGQFKQAAGSCPCLARDKHFSSFPFF